MKSLARPSSPALQLQRLPRPLENSMAKIQIKLTTGSVSNDANVSTIFHGEKVSIAGGKVLIDGTEVASEASKLQIHIEGNIQQLQVDAAQSITVSGSAGDVRTHSGDVKCGAVSGSVQTESGDVSCGDVGGSVATSSGDIQAQAIQASARSDSGDIFRK